MATEKAKKKQQPKYRYAYSSGVVIDGELWVENNDGNLEGNATRRDANAKLHSSKKKAMENANQIAAAFRGKKVTPFVESHRRKVKENSNVKKQSSNGRVRKK